MKIKNDVTKIKNITYLTPNKTLYVKNKDYIVKSDNQNNIETLKKCFSSFY